MKIINYMYDLVLIVFLIYTQWSVQRILMLKSIEQGFSNSFDFLYIIWSRKVFSKDFANIFFFFNFSYSFHTLDIAINCFSVAKTLLKSINLINFSIYFILFSTDNVKAPFPQNSQHCCILFMLYQLFPFSSFYS